jgi:hypothetical protein
MACAGNLLGLQYVFVPNNGILSMGDLFKHMFFWNLLVMASTATEYH